MLTLFTGGVRSGKSSAAELAASLSGSAVIYIATATAGDEEMTARIERHQADRRAEWTTIEEPKDLVGAVVRIGGDQAILIDCLSLWVSNVMTAPTPWPEPVVVAAARELGELLASRPGPSFVVSNEVGSGIVPANKLAREYRDVLGRVNQEVARCADRAYVVCAGRLLSLVDPRDVFGD